MFVKLQRTEESGGGDNENSSEAEANTASVSFTHFRGYSSMAGTSPSAHYSFGCLSVFNFSVTGISEAVYTGKSNNSNNCLGGIISYTFNAP
jgi:hypothetical protein